MSAETANAAGTRTSLTPTVRQAVRRWRVTAAIALAVVVVGLLSLLLSGSMSTRNDFAPDNPGPRGAMALARVLEQQGVAVTATGSFAAATRSTDGTVFIDDRGALLTDDELRRIAAATDRLVVLAPDSDALDTLLPGVRLAGTPDRTRAPADCALGLARRAGTLNVTAASGSLRAASGAAATVCFTDSRGAGQLAAGRLGTAEVLVLASPEPFENEHITAAGNAALALAALGVRDTLTWYVPDPVDLGATSTVTLQDITPTWVTPLMIMLLTAGFAAALWRGRRLGPLAVERLPVTVRSRETVEGRARLYERSTARTHAADALRMGALGRIDPLLGHSRTTPLESVITSIADRTGIARPEVERIVLAEEPSSDRALVRLAAELADLEAAVRRAVRPGTDPRSPAETPPTTNGASR